MKLITVILLILPSLASCQNDKSIDGNIHVPLPPALESWYATIQREDSIEFEKLILNLKDLKPFHDSIGQLLDSLFTNNIYKDKLVMSDKYIALVFDQYYILNADFLMQFILSRYNLQVFNPTLKDIDFINKFPLLKYLALHYEADEIIRGIEINKSFLSIGNSSDFDNFNMNMARAIGFGVYSKVTTDLYHEKRSKLYDYINWEIKYYDGSSDSSYVRFLEKLKLNMDQLFSF